MWVTKAPSANSHLTETDREGQGHIPSAWNGQVLEFSFDGYLIICSVGGNSWNLKINVFMTLLPSNPHIYIQTSFSDTANAQSR